jgi:mannose-1-phosphate guanylyltransferase
VVIGPHCHIKSGARLKNCTILGNTTVGKGSFIENSIISWRCKVGEWVRIEGLSCIAEEVEIKDEARVTECMVLSNKAVSGVLEHKVVL